MLRWLHWLYSERVELFSNPCWCADNNYPDNIFRLHDTISYLLHLKCFYINYIARVGYTVEVFRSFFFVSFIKCKYFDIIQQNVNCDLCTLSLSPVLPDQISISLSQLIYIPADLFDTKMIRFTIKTLSIIILYIFILRF